jgi:hypothetical protein
MADRWEICRVNNNADIVDYYSPQKWGIGYEVKVYLLENYPSTQLRKKGPHYPDLIKQLLKDGWEPLTNAFSNYNEYWSFRRKVNE